MTWGSLGARVLTNSQFRKKKVEENTDMEFGKDAINDDQ